MLLPTSLLPKLLAELQPPLGVARKDSRAELLSRLAQYQIPEHNGVVHFVEVLIPLASAASGVTLSDREVRRQQQHVRQTFPELLTLETVRYCHAPVHVGHYIAQTYVASAFRGQRTRRRVETAGQDRVRQLQQYLREHPNAPEEYRRRLSVMKRYWTMHATDSPTSFRFNRAFGPDVSTEGGVETFQLEEI